MTRWSLTLVLIATAAAPALGRELTSSYVVPAVVNKTGERGTDWHTDLTFFNPHTYTLPVVVQFLPSGQANLGAVPTLEFDVLANETLNVWDVLGEHGFDARGQLGALLVSADGTRITCPDASAPASQQHACDFTLFSRTYTLNPNGEAGEFGMAVPGFPSSLGLDWTVYATLPQLMDDADFRTNLGVASWTGDWVKVRVDLQNASGDIVDRRDHWVPPYGHIQWRLEQGVTGGSAVVYIVDGPNDAMVYPYATPVNNVTGDGVYVEAGMTPVGIGGVQSIALAKALNVPPRWAPRACPGRAPVPGFSAQELRVPRS